MQRYKILYNRDLMRYAITFPGLKNGERILVMPVELMEKFNILDTEERQKLFIEIQSGYN